ncbi:flagellar assembly protein FliH [Bacillus sp. cl95]|uniref:flagellar assembly protein FliH n=1 Tax=Bacillus sp. UNCCL13 TaxID=1502772 RepID=UPI0008E46A84|nr:flagellar assembly protein FliH [Bacillus sp. UNCCL13]SFA74077.1 flagellar assembly protein FliH [Bacillus sp. UNCCL13]SFQ64302.1 flagellar assembly protein FliH [Bacillus sp. cl95]
MSKVIKSHWTKQEDTEKKVISIKVMEPSREEIQTPLFIHSEDEKQEIIEKAKHEAELILEEARVHAQSMREKIDSEAETWEQEKLEMAERARLEGYDKGLNEGREKGYSEYQETILHAREVVETSKQDYIAHIEASEKTIVDLAMKAAEKILGKMVKGDSEQFISIVKRALKEAKEHSEIQLHINPIHYGFLLSQKEELSALFPRETDLYIYPDDALLEDSCIIESASGRIDASVDVQLAEIKRRLLELLESEQS